MVSLKERNITCLSLAFLICEMAKALITSKSMIYGMIFSLGVICNQSTHLPLSVHSPMNSHLGSFQRLLLWEEEGSPLPSSPHSTNYPTHG